MPSIRTVDGQLVDVYQKTSVLISVDAGISWLAVALVLLAAILVFFFPFGFVVSIILIVLALPLAINAKVLSFLRTKADMSLDRATVDVGSGATATLRRDRSFWITSDMFVAALAGVGLLAAFAAGGAIVQNSALTNVLGVFAGFAGVVLLASIFVLNFLRKKLVIPEGELTLTDVSGQRLRLTRHTSIWVTLGMLLSVLTSLFLLYAFTTDLGSAYQSASSFNGYYNRFGSFLPSDFQFAQFAYYLGPALSFFLFLFSLIQVAVLNFLRTKVNLEVMGAGAGTPLSPTPPTSPSSRPRVGVVWMGPQRFCPYCGNGLGIGDQFCRKCGRQQPTD